MKKYFALTILCILTLTACNQPTAEETTYPNEVIETIMTRRSVRQYNDEPISHEVMDKILECGIHAPNGMNAQRWEVRVVESKKWIDDVTAAYKNSLAEDSPMAEQFKDPNFKNIFRNAAVRNRTSHSDFHFSDLRGMVDPRDGKIKPITVYLSINMVDAQALNPITAIFIELMSNFLLAHKPGDMHHGQKLGPCPVLFAIDEMPKMQKLRAIIEGPDLGRGQKISYLIIGQDLHQIQEKYGADAAATIISTTAAKIVMRQNDPDTADRFSKMMGYKMKKKTVKGPDGKDKEETTEELLFTPMDIMKMNPEEQLVIIQGHYNRPIKADQERWYKNSTAIQKKLYAKVQMGECAPLPEFLVPAHHRALGYSGTPRIYDPMTQEIKELVSA